MPKGMNRRPPAESPFQAANFVQSAQFTVAAEAASAINVAVQLGDANDNAIGAVGAVMVYLSDSADGHTLTASTPTSMLIGTNGLVLDILTASLVLLVLSNTAGKFDLTISKNAANNYYLCVILPDGSIAVSPVIPMV